THRFLPHSGAWHGGLNGNPGEFARARGLPVPAARSTRLGRGREFGRRWLVATGFTVLRNWMLKRPRPSNIDPGAIAIAVTAEIPGGIGTASDTPSGRNASEGGKWSGRRSRVSQRCARDPPT